MVYRCSNFFASNTAWDEKLNTSSCCLSVKKWILRKFADSWNGTGETENAPLLTKRIYTFSTVEFLFNISKLA